MLRPCLFATLVFLSAPLTLAQEYSVEKIDEAPEAEGVSDEIAELIAEDGYRVNKGSRTFCEIWFCKELKVDPDFEATEQRLYPFEVGQLVGLLHFGRRGSEFRDQQISSGWYTLRFGLQPIDGNHVGTSPTRDFLLLVDAEEDELPENWSEEDLYEMSAEAAGSTHPALFCLQRPSEGSELTIRHNEQHDWWVMHLDAAGSAGGKPVSVPIDLVVVGYAAE